MVFIQTSGLSRGCVDKDFDTLSLMESLLRHPNVPRGHQRRQLLCKGRAAAVGMASGIPLRVPGLERFEEVSPEPGLRACIWRRLNVCNSAYFERDRQGQVSHRVNLMWRPHATTKQ